MRLGQKLAGMTLEKILSDARSWEGRKWLCAN